MIDLTDKGFCIFGSRGGGKSWLVKHILDSTPNHLIYDPMQEHQGYRRYVPDDRESVQELSDLVKSVVVPTKPALFIVDEANKYVLPKPNRLPDGVNDLMDFGRHWGISVGFVSRRPVQFHTDLVELSNVLFFYGLTGNNDYHYLENLHMGLGDAVRNLGEFQFMSLSSGRDMELHNPIDSPGHPNHTGPAKQNSEG